MTDSPEFRNASKQYLSEEGYVSHTTHGYWCPYSRARDIAQGCGRTGGYIDITGSGIGLEGSVDRAYDEIAQEMGVKVVRMRESGGIGARDSNNGLIRFVTNDLDTLCKKLNEKKLLGDEDLVFIQEQEKVTGLAQKKAEWLAAAAPSSATTGEINGGTRMPRGFDVKLGKYIAQHAAEVGEALRGREAPELAKRAAEAASITRRMEMDADRPRPMFEVVLADDPGREQQASQRKLDCQRLVACASALCPEVLEQTYPNVSPDEIAERLAGSTQDTGRVQAELHLKIKETTGKEPSSGGRRF